MSQPAWPLSSYPSPHRSSGISDFGSVSSFGDFEKPNRKFPTDASSRKGLTSTVEEMDDGEGVEEWAPGWRNQFPWLGLGGFSVMFIAMALSIVILCTSNERQVTEWPTKIYPVTPNVVLNIANQVASFGLVTAIGQGLAIAWWRKALRGGTLETLHRNHTYSTSLMAALKSGRHFNILALAALTAKFAVIDSTLFQKSTTVSSDYKENYLNKTVEAWVTTKWPDHFGGIPGSDGDMRALNENFGNIITQYNTRIGNGKVHDTNILFRNCPFGQTCTGSLEAIGFDYSCTTTTTPVDYGSFRLLGALYPQKLDGYPLYSVDFQTVWPSATRKYTSINMTMVYVDSKEGEKLSCPGTLTTRTCEIRPAVVRYPLSVLMADKKQAMNVTHLQFYDTTLNSYPYAAPMTDSQIDGIEVIEKSDLIESTFQPTTVGAMTFVLNNLFKSSANLTWQLDWDLSVSGARAQSLYSANSTNSIAQHCAYSLNSTASGVADPFIDLLRRVNQLGFITSLFVDRAWALPANGSARTDAGYKPVTFDTQVKGYVEQYHTNYRIMAGALVATLVTILAVLPVYWGFWQLGRKFTLDPFEISNAFNAPIFAGAHNKNKQVDELISEVGQRRVQYGQLLHGNDSKGQLGLAEPHRVARPMSMGRARLSSAELSGKIGVGAVLGGMGAAMTLGKGGN
jgi:hypothetical protein